nr:30S ribosomal protein S20 [Ruminococcus bromii]
MHSDLTKATPSFAVKVIATKTARNKATKSALRTAVKKAYYAVDTNADNKTEAVRLAIKKIDQAAAKGILHKNTAARSKSSLAKRLNASA